MNRSIGSSGSSPVGRIKFVSPFFFQYFLFLKMAADLSETEVKTEAMRRISMVRRQSKVSNWLIGDMPEGKLCNSME